MSIQAQLNREAFMMLPKTYAAMRNETNGNVLGSMEQSVLRALGRCSPCLEDMTDQQKADLDNKMINLFKHYEWI